MPVLPLVASSSRLPGRNAPDCHAVSMILNAARSLTDPPGLAHSALPRISICSHSRVRLSNRSRGVFPTRAKGLVPCAAALIGAVACISYFGSCSAGSPDDEIPSCDGGHNRNGIAGLDRSIRLLQIADVFIV